MKAYRTGTKIKLGLIAAAVVIAVASLLYTNRLADRVARQEQEAVRLWVRALEYQAGAAAHNPYEAELGRLDSLLGAAEAEGLVSDPAGVERLQEAVRWARAQPTSEELDFVFNEIIEPGRFSVPAIITDSAMTFVAASRNVAPEDEARLLALARAMDEVNEPIRLELSGQTQYAHYGASELERLIRWFPPIQLLFVGLFILVGYLGFSYIRRSEQSNLWVGMAKEAAHQLGTPLSSMMGWIELLRLHHVEDPARGEGHAQAETVADELEQDVARLRRVADRFEKIGSVPELRPTPLLPVLEGVAGYIRRRMPRVGPRVTLDLYCPPDLAAALNPELFEWVIENLLKNALDAMEGDGQIVVEATRGRGGEARIEVRDTGKGMDRATARHIFRPGFSTKRRGWGLGLSLARRIVEEYHGGSLTLAESTPGVGSTFLITLRAVALPPSEPAPASPTERRPEAV